MEVEVEKDYVITISPDCKKGIKVRIDHYYAIKSTLLSTLMESDGMSFNSLVTKLHSHFEDELKENTGWYIYKIKLDLEARGLITHDRFSKTIICNAKSDHRKPELEFAYARSKRTPMNNLNKQKVITTVKEKFIELFKELPLIVNSPGRINLLGEHTDYNNGYVLPAAIDKGIQLAICETSGKQSMLYSLRYNQFFAVDHTKIEIVKKPVWANYFLGVIHQLQARGYKVPSFNCVFDGDLPLGAGLSSSAAVECAFVYALNELFNLEISKLDLIHIAQWAEHNYVGVKCGIMDQFASVMGRENHIMLLDCQDLEYDFFPIQLKQYSLLLCDTGVKHSLASSEYNTRRNQCDEGVWGLRTKYPEINSLRDVSMQMLIDNKVLLSEIAFNRCLYIIEENNRVLNGCKDLQDGNLEAFGRKMFETHHGLSRLYDVSCPELDFLVECAKNFKGVLGSRMMGGGFGGCTLTIIDNDLIGAFTEQTRKSYKNKFGIEMKSYVVRTGNGTSVIENPLTVNH
jgi:galactokinase